jgi:DNA polymerase III epsilon subunit-like protein
MNCRKIVVYDLETTAADPQLAEPVEIGAIVIDPFNLQIIPGSEFISEVQPTCEESISQGTVDWHAKRDGVTAKEVRERWAVAPAQKIVWQQFTEYLDRYHTKMDARTSWTAPIRAGFNIINFDDIIMNRLAKKYHNKYLFSQVSKIDLYDMLFFWFEGVKSFNKYNFDVYREFFGLSTAKAHTASVDVEQFAKIIIRMLKHHRRLFKSSQFEGSFSEITNQTQ